MIILTQTTDKIQVVLQSAITTTQPTFFASWRQLNQPTDTEFTPDRNAGSTNSTTQVDMVGSPASGKQRLIESIIIYNADTVSVTVSVIFDANGTDYIIQRATLNVGETLSYTDGDGWRVTTQSGDIKTVVEIGSAITSGAMNAVILSSDVTNNNATANTMQDITGLSFSAKALSRYWYRFVIHYTAAATTTGSRWGVNCNASINELRGRSEYSLTTTTKTINEGISAYDSPSASNATSAATESNIAIIEGIFRPATDGTFIGRFASEVSSSAIIAKAGSILYWGEL